MVEANPRLTVVHEKSGIKHEFHETPGAHRWMVWRRYRAQCVPKLFRVGGR